jgi:hypothetical protein
MAQKESDFLLKILTLNLNIVVGDESAFLQAHWFRSEGKIHLSKWRPEVWNRKIF